MVMVVNSGRWCLGFLGNDGFPDQLKLWLQIHCDEELRIHMVISMAYLTSCTWCCMAQPARLLVGLESHIARPAVQQADGTC